MASIPASPKIPSSLKLNPGNYPKPTGYPPATPKKGDPVFKHTFFVNAYMTSDAHEDFDGPRWFKVILTDEIAKDLLRKIKLAKLIEEQDKYFESLFFLTPDATGVYYYACNDDETDVHPEHTEPCPVINHRIVVTPREVCWTGVFDGPLTMDIETRSIRKSTLEKIAQGIQPGSQYEEILSDTSADSVVTDSDDDSDDLDSDGEESNS